MKQRTLDEYTDIRKYTHLYLGQAKNAIWESGGMTKEIHEAIDEVLEWEEKTHLEVLAIYEQYETALSYLDEEEPKGLEAMIEHGFVSDEPDTEEQA